MIEPDRTDGRLRSADPGSTPGRHTMPAGTVFVIIVGALGLAALLNARPMLRAVETSELGTGRDLALAFWQPVELTSSRLGLGAPRSIIESLRPPSEPAYRMDPPSDDGSGLVVAAGAPGSGRLGHEPYVPGAAVPDTADPLGPATTVPPAGPESEQSPLGLPEPPPSSTAGDPAEGTVGGHPGGEELPPGGEGVVDPLRLLIVGDSSIDAVGTSLLRELATTPSVVATLDARISTGLSRPDFFDWPTHLRSLVETNRAEVVVIMLGANDAQPFLVDGEPESYGTDRWFATYRARVAGLLAQLTADGARVIWVGQPVMRATEFDAKMAAIDEIYRQEVDRSPAAVFVDSRGAMSGGTGAYQAYLTDGAGDQVLVRAGDGIHLTPAGGDRLADVILGELQAMTPLS